MPLGSYKTIGGAHLELCWQSNELLWQPKTTGAWENLMKPRHLADLVLYGTPFPASEEADPKKFVPVWKQQATDEKGRKRFHGAFTGGFSAGYFNTVGSKEGWAPSAFKSSRGVKPSCAATSVVSVEDFMDEEDLADYTAKKLVAVDDSKGGDALESLLAFKASIGDHLLAQMGFTAQTMCNPPHLVLLEQYRKSIRHQPSQSISAGMGFGAEDIDEDDLDVYKEHSIALPPSFRQAERTAFTTFAVKAASYAELIGFVLGPKVDAEPWYAPPNVPDDFTPTGLGHAEDLSNVVTGVNSIKTRAKLLGEGNEPAREVFDPVDPDIASAALGGFMPFERSDLEKHRRYMRFLRLAADGRPVDSAWLPDFSARASEHAEFYHACHLYQPLSTAMHDKFVESKEGILLDSDSTRSGIYRPVKNAASTAPKPTNVEDASVAIKQKGRVTKDWLPSSLLSKRFGCEKIDEPLQDIEAAPVEGTSLDQAESAELSPEEEVGALYDDLIRPGIDIFKQIFGTDIDITETTTSSKVTFRKPAKSSMIVEKPSNPKKATSKLSFSFEEEDGQATTHITKSRPKASDFL